MDTRENKSTYKKFNSFYGLFNVLNGLSNNLLLVALGGENACNVEHGTTSTALISGGALETRTLDVGERALESGVEFSLHLFEGQLGAWLGGGIKQLVLLLKFLD